jgi:hypothetical protein
MFKGKLKGLSKYISEIVFIFLIIYLLVSIFAAIALKLGWDDIGDTIHKIYRIFCHQRIERSPLLFGSDPQIFYTSEELKALGAIPEYNPHVPVIFSNEVFGYPYTGNANVGFKTALCIRDLALYVGMIALGSFYFARIYIKDTLTKFNWRIAVILMMPMVLDVGIQIIAQVFSWDFISDEYIGSISKRIVTGLLFGIGFGMIVFPNLKVESVTK